MFRLGLFCLLIFVASNVISQVDYNEFKKKFPLTCTKFDDESVLESQRVLDSLNQYEITGGRELFLNNYATTYYFRYGKWGSIEDLKMAIEYYEKGYKEFNTSGFAWSLTLYEKLGECEKALKYLDIYLELRKKEGIEIDYEQVYYVQRNCCN
ncbi:MAG: hypothetical protein RIE58_06095 [Vicingaceae bacterium]